MDFIVRLEDGTQQGPLDQETLRKWVDIDKVKHDTPVRNALLQNWKTAQEFDFLHDALEAQAMRAQARSEEKNGFLARLLGGPQERPKAQPPKEVSSAFKYEYIPNPASVPLRLGAAIFDWLLIGAFALILLVAGMSVAYLNASANTPQGEQVAAKAADSVAPEEKPKPVDSLSETRIPCKTDDASKGFHLGTIWTDTSSNIVYACVKDGQGEALWCEREYMNSLFLKLFSVFCVVTLFYLGFSLGFFSQTFGMWFWGILIVKSADGAPVFPLRAFAFAVLLIPLGFLMPVLSYVIPDKRSLHDMIAGVKLIGIAAKPKS